MPTHYDTLGVVPTASAEELRSAYHRRARQLHPDRQSGATPAQASVAERGMQDLNEAWRVLRDPGRRSVYDTRLRAGTTPGSTSARAAAASSARFRLDDDDDRPFVHRPAEPGDVGIRLARSLPWVAICLVLAAIFVFTAFAGSPGTPGTSTTQLAGRCVRFGADIAPVPCDQPNDGRVDLVVTEPSDCPRQTDFRQFAGRYLCLRPSGVEVTVTTSG